MSLLAYRPDWASARRRLTRWWQGGDIGRPVVQMSVPRDEPWEHIPAVPCPTSWQNRYSVVSLDYKVYLARKACVGREFFGRLNSTIVLFLALALVHPSLRLDVVDVLGQRIRMHRTVTQANVVLFVHPRQRVLHPGFVVAVREVFLGMRAPAFFTGGGVRPRCLNTFLRSSHTSRFAEGFLNR